MKNGMKKKWMLAVLSVALAVQTLAGCGGTETDSSSAGGAQGATIVAEEPQEEQSAKSTSETDKTDAGAGAPGAEDVVDIGSTEGGGTRDATEADLLAYRVADVKEDAAVAQYPNLDEYADDWDAYTRAWEAWWAESAERRKVFDNNVGALYHYYQESAPIFLRDDGRENAVYSPLNVYLALTLLAETTDGASRQQIVDLLEGDVGHEDVLRTDDAGRALTSWEWRAMQLMKANSVDDGIVTSRLANSLWLNGDLEIKEDTVQRIAGNLRAEIFSGEMGSDPFNQALQTWLDVRTGGLLAQQARGVTMRPETVLALASALYFKASWTQKFDGAATKRRTFHAPDGDAEVDMMYGEGISRDYFHVDGLYTGTSLDLEYSGRMYLFLPDAGRTPGDLLTDGRALREICGMTTEDRKGAPVNVSLPKFDVDGDMSLIEGMQALGIMDVFDAETADFSPITDRDDVALTQARHAARVVADEEGVLGAAFTVMMMEATAEFAPEEPREIVFDRPFLFAVTGEDGSILLLGVVNRPVY